MVRKSINIEKEVYLSARQFGLTNVLATVSGGPDSIVLLHTLSKIPFLNVVAAHCNFHLRGEESDRDQKLVEETCKKLSVHLELIHFDTMQFVNANKGISVEMACRRLRYDWFNKLMSKHSLQRIATGHNADDNIETMFLNLFRGSGTEGLKGMLPDNGSIWRPLLSFHRKDIMQYIDKNGLQFVIDSSNNDTDYRRNFIRNEIIPSLKTRWEGIEKALDKSVTYMREENKVVDAMVRSVLPPEGEPLFAETILSFPSPPLLVRRFIEKAKPFNTTPDEIVSAIHADKPDVKRWILKEGTVELRGNKLRVFSQK